MSQEAASGQYVVVGHIGALHGLRGWLKLHSHTDPPDNILSYPEWYVGTGEQRRCVRVVASRQAGKGLLVQLESENGEVMGDREAAAPLVGTEITIPREAMAPPAPGEYYWADLVGLEVQTVEGRQLGAVAYLLETGANDVLVVKGDRERLIPFLQGDTVKTVDVAVGRIVVDWNPEF